ncbi:hypothetical protein [Acinetobacter guillouiae]|uniref:hypothetical protein n=1 Tax=Acinetobacter guillouiae TaxID=106649 RepID=UPI0002D09769|nr:hypothetical protein [Acinetobacter guillouiae]ENU59246.1 hypothetical protein F981_01339 [Acinetobacter guillouiae CIP 63.46]KAB0628682.1 hypothetical protein F7P82_05910 [Acinetobacter guillouiae]
MIIIPASEAKKISEASKINPLHQLNINLINNIIVSAGRGEKFANEYITNEIPSSEIKTLIKEFQREGYNVKITDVSNQIIFSISW